MGINRERWKDYNINRLHGNRIKGKAGAIIFPVSPQRKGIKALEVKVKSLEQRITELEKG